MEPDEGTGGVEKDGVDDSEGDEGDPPAIEVHGAPVVASGIEEDHCVWCVMLIWLHRD